SVSPADFSSTPRKAGSNTILSAPSALANIGGVLYRKPAGPGDRRMIRYDVAGMGNAIVDVIAGVDDQFLLDHAIAKNVMTLIDEYRAAELYAKLPAPREIAGGSAANTMAALASLGGNGLFIGKVKHDRLGKSFAESMKDSRIDFETAMAKDGPSTACCLIAVTPDGH